LRSAESAVSAPRAGWLPSENGLDERPALRGRQWLRHPRPLFAFVQAGCAWLGLGFRGSVDDAVGKRYWLTSNAGAENPCSHR